MEEENIYFSLREIALTQFSQIVDDAVIITGPLNTPRSLRIFFHEGSFAEIRVSRGKYSYHWERRMINGEVYRYDNAPHHRGIRTFPKHFHSGTDDKVEESKLSDDPKIAVMEFLEFIRKMIGG